MTNTLSFSYLPVGFQFGKMYSICWLSGRESMFRKSDITSTGLVKLFKEIHKLQSEHEDPVTWLCKCSDSLLGICNFNHKSLAFWTAQGVMSVKLNSSIQGFYE